MGVGAQEWSYLRGGLSTLDRDYGIFNKIHHSIGTHVVHHLLPQIPHYNLDEATAAVKPVMGSYYRCGCLSSAFSGSTGLDPVCCTPGTIREVTL